MSTERLNQPSCSIGEIINAQLAAGASVIYLGELGRKLGIPDIKVEGRIDSLEFEPFCSKLS